MRLFGKAKKLLIGRYLRRKAQEQLRRLGIDPDSLVDQRVL